MTNTSDFNKLNEEAKLATVKAALTKAGIKWEDEV